MKRSLLSILCVFYITILVSQEKKVEKSEPIIFETVEAYDIEEVEDDELILVTVPFSIVEITPLYKGCEEFDGMRELKKCTSNKIREFIDKKFKKKY